MTHYSYRDAQGAGDWIMGAVKSNPEGLLLLAAGCALLLRSGAFRRSAHALEGFGSAGSGRERRSEDDEPGQTGAGSSTMSQAVDSARDYAADVSKAVSDKAGTYASAVGDYADDAWRQSERFVVQARRTVQNTIDRVLQEQPLAVAVAGLAAGAAVAVAFPASAVERRMLGPAGERLTDAAASAGQQLRRQAAAKAGEMLMDAADRRGLNAKGLKEVATNVAGAVGGAFTGEKGGSDQPAASTGGAPRSSQGGTSEQSAPRTANRSFGEPGSTKSKKPGGSGQF